MENHSGHPAAHRPLPIPLHYTPITLKGRYKGKLSAQEITVAQRRRGDAALGPWHQRVWERFLQWRDWSHRRSAKMACRDMYHARTDQEKLHKFMALRDLVVDADRARFKCEFRGALVKLRVAASPLEIELGWAEIVCLSTPPSAG